MPLNLKFTGPGVSVVEHPLQEREVVGSNSSHAIQKALKTVPVATLLGAQHYKASTGFSSPNKYRTTNITTLTKKVKKKRSLIIINVCIHQRTVWKTGSYAKYIILLKYRDYYYYYYSIYMSHNATSEGIICIARNKYNLQTPIRRSSLIRDYTVCFLEAC